jgi:4-nitrophenyl phosphatase
MDLDGTVYRGESVIPGAPTALSAIRSAGILVRFLTNNSTQAPESFAAKLSEMDIPTSRSEVMTSGVGVAKRLEADGIRKVFVVGEDGLRQTLTQSGIEESDEPDAVVVGLCRSFNYDLLTVAMRHIRAGAAFYATNPDTTYPIEGGQLIPGAGSLAASVAAASGRSPKTIGKPSPYLVHLVLEETRVNASDAIMVGDRLDTDIEAGRRAGTQLALVMSGVESTAPIDVPHWLSINEWVSSLGLGRGSGFVEGPDNREY